MRAPRHCPRELLGLLVAGLLVTAYPLAGCGGSDDGNKPGRPPEGSGSSERGAPGAEQTVKSYLAAFSRGDGEAACGFFSEAYKKEFVRRNAAASPPLAARNCPELVHKQHARLEQAGGLSFEGTRLTPSVVRDLDLKTALRLNLGDRDSATVKGSKGQRVFELEVIDGHWTITTISS